MITQDFLITLFSCSISWFVFLLSVFLPLFYILEKALFKYLFETIIELIDWVFAKIKKRKNGIVPEKM